MTVWVMGYFIRNSSIRIGAITDGTSQTVMLLERAWGDSEGTWTGATPAELSSAVPKTLARAPRALRYLAPAWSRCTAI